MRNNKKNNSGGFGLIEIIVATAVISISIFSLANVVQVSFRVAGDTFVKTKAEFLAEEGVEAVRFLRDTSWSSEIDGRVIGVSYYLSFSTTTSTWTLGTSTEEIISGIYTREIIFDDVYRKDSDDDIVDISSTDGKTLDPETKKITSRVSWGGGGIVSLLSYEGGTTDTNLANFPSNNTGDGDPAQSFTTPELSEVILISSVELLLRQATTSIPSDIFLEIRSGSTVGSLIATSSILSSSNIATSSLTWINFSFPSDTSLATSTQYFLRLQSIPSSTVPFSGSSGTIYWGYLELTPSPYGGGEAYRHVGANNDPAYAGEILSQYDFSFRINSSQEKDNRIEFVTYLADIFGN